MKIKSCILLALVLLSNLVRANEIIPYAWEKSRARYPLSESDKAMSELVLKHHTQYQYTLENDQFVMYSTVHQIILVTSDEAVKKNNRIVISMNSTIELTDLQARAINRDGKAVYFDKNNLKELKNEESGNAYRIFAIEGIELGSEIEYFYTRKMTGGIYDRVFMQFDVPVKNGSFLLTCPKHLRFDFKSYEGLAAVVVNEGEEKNQYTLNVNDIPAMKEEPFSYFDPNRKRIEFKLAYNIARSQARLYTWEEAAKTFYNILYDVTKDDEKAVDKFLKGLGDNPSKSIDDRIRNIEHKIKMSIKVSDERSDKSLSSVESIIKSKISSREGITKLFLSVFNKLGIACAPAITCSRENIRFDGKFDSWTYLDDYVVYFTGPKTFLAPYKFETRYPLIPSEWTAQQALFIEPLTIGSLKSALGSIAEIPAADYTLSNDDLEIEVSFNDDLSSANIHQKRLFGGYNALFFTPYYDLMTSDQRKQFVEELIKQTAPDATIAKWDTKLITDKKSDSFLMDAEFQTASFSERAGPRILFKAGELIGSQVEMYRDDKRVTQVENGFNRGYDRFIRINIPQGYSVKNPQDLKIDITYSDGSETPFLFQSDYVVKGNTLEITIKEYYKKIYAPVERYEDFRKVINAAADFNKVTLVFEKNKN
jgi:hypothetical protein